MESLQSHFILTLSHWSSGLPVCFPSQGTRVQNPWGDLCETGILLLALSCYVGDPDVIDHFCGLVWGGLCPKTSLGPRVNNVIIALDLTKLFCPGFTLAAGSPYGFTTDGIGCGGEPCGEPAISLHSHHVSLLQWTTRLLPVTRDQVQNPWGGLMWNRDSPVSIVSLQYIQYFTICLNIFNIKVSAYKFFYFVDSVSHVLADVWSRFQRDYVMRIFTRGPVDEKSRKTLMTQYLEDNGSSLHIYMVSALQTLN